MHKLLLSLLLASLLAGCASAPRVKSAHGTASSPTAARSGGYYLDDGPGANPPPNLEAVPDAVPRNEPLNPYANRPYQALGTTYVPITEVGSLHQEGIASWYGRRYHGKKTSSGEIYDMYAMTAAHPTLPIPSYARVTSLASGKSVVVRINDRGPFHSDRVIDLSYTAAYKLGLLGRGSARVSVESIDPASFVARNDEAPPSQPASVAAQAKPLPASGYYVQLGVFGSPENAERLQAQARASLGISAELVQVARVDNLHRVKLGPFANQDEASGWAEKTRAALGIAAITVTP